MKGFREFLLRGNVVDLAVAVVIGVAFGAVITALVTDLITPLIGIPGHLDLNSNTFTVNGSVFKWGAFIGAVINFVLIAAAVYFVVVRPVQRLMERRAKPPTDVTTRECPECLSTIPKAARRCSFCTSEVGAVA
jgi:large conductance mechanosensitive channel